MTPLRTHYRLQDLQLFCSNISIEHGAHTELFTEMLAIPEYRVLREIRRSLRA